MCVYFPVQSCDKNKKVVVVVGGLSSLSGYLKSK